jgi:hypothetical protein
MFCVEFAVHTTRTKETGKLDWLGASHTLAAYVMQSLWAIEHVGSPARNTISTI